MFNKKDPRDEIISMLRLDKERLELRVTELTKQVIILSNRPAFRELYPTQSVGEKEQVELAPPDPRTKVYVPRQSFKDIEAAMVRRELKERGES